MRNAFRDGRFCTIRRPFRRSGPDFRSSRSARPVFVLFLWKYGAKFVSVRLYDAINEMRRLSREGVPFSFSFMSYNSSQGTSDGVVYVRRARTMSRESLEFNQNAEMQERYMDLDTMQPRRFWHPLLMTLNGEKVTV